jgi:hypothetical protein
MPLRSCLLLLLTLLVLSTGCVRRNRAKRDAANAPVEAPRTVEDIRRDNARDLASVMADELQLREDQVLRVRQILTTTVEQVNAAQAKHSTNKTALMTALKQINMASEAQLKQAMSPAQYKLYQQRKPQIQAKLRQQQQK